MTASEAELMRETLSGPPTPQRKYRPYRSSKPSHIPGLNRIPAHWVAARADAYIREIGTQVSTDWLAGRQVVHYSIPVVQETGTAAIEDGEHIDSAKTLITEPCVLVSKLNPRKGTIAHCEPDKLPTVCSGEFVALACPGAELRYVEYLFRSETIRQLLDSSVQSVTRSHQRTSPATIRKLWWGWPPRQEQRAIAAFLDRETARIDALIAKKERLIELLQEKRAALISHVVTKGLNRERVTKRNNIEWLPEIPDSWRVVRLKFLLQGGLANGVFKKAEHFGSGCLLVNVFDIYREDFLIDPSTLDRVRVEDVELDRFRVRVGDVFFVRSSLKLEGVGRSACIVQIPEPTVFECHLVRGQPNERTVLPHYLVSFLNSTYATNRLIALANQVTMTTLGQEKLASLEIPLPPLPEQQAIVGRLNDELLQLRDLSGQTTKTIERLCEYRSALISAAVTGKIDVREEA